MTHFGNGQRKHGAGSCIADRFRRRDAGSSTDPGQAGLHEHDQSDVAIPGGEAPHFVILQTDRFAGLDFPHGIVAWTTVVNLAKSVSEDIYKRPFITVGFATWCTMLPLAVTSTAGWIRRLGGRRWSRLHRLVYATGVLGVLHYWWLVKADVRRPLTYGFVVAVLLASRVYWSRVRSVSPAAAPRAAKSSVRL